MTTGCARIGWTVFLALAREEWRLHTRLFGGWRFICFPLLIAGLAASASVALVATGTAVRTVVDGLHALAFGFGLYCGTAGFAGSDMLENVFGRLSLLLSTATALPLSRRRVLGIFLLKDALFYGVVFILPMAVARVPLVGLSVKTPVALGLLWLSLSLVFAIGMVLTVAAIAARTRGVPTWGILLVTALTAGGVWTMDLFASARVVLVPLHSSWLTAVGLAVATLLVGISSVTVYDPAYARPVQTVSDRFVRLSDALPVGPDALVAKALLDLARSSGGVWKPFVSVSILFALVAALVGLVREITGVEPATGIFFGGVLGLSAFTTYNWLTQFDSLDAYLAYPISVADVFRAKRTAFVVVGAPTAAVPYLAAVVWFEAAVLDAVAGAVVLAGYAPYYYGLTVYVAGFDPNEFLFDAVRFGLFTVGVAVPLVPTLVAGFVAPPSTALTAALVCSGIGFGVVGYHLSSRAGPRWDEHYRSE